MNWQPVLVVYLSIGVLWAALGIAGATLFLDVSKQIARDEGLDPDDLERKARDPWVIATTAALDVVAWPYGIVQMLMMRTFGGAGG